MSFIKHRTTKVIFSKDKYDKDPDIELIDIDLLINYENLSFLKIMSETENGIIVQTRYYRFNQEIEKTYKFSKTMDGLRQFLSKKGLYKLEDYFINTDLLMCVEVQDLNRQEVQLTFNFINGTSCEIITKVERWNSWSLLRLK